MMSGLSCYNLNEVENMKENRYFQMIYLLLEKGTITAPVLAKHFEVSVRTIYRDVDVLSAAGIPVFAVQGKGGGISIQENFVLNKSILSEHEQKQILMSLQGINIVNEENTNLLLSKLGGVFQKQNVNWLEIDFSGWKNYKNKYIFNILKEAIFKNIRVSFHYFSGKGENSKRCVEPLKLVCKNMNWFLYGYCCDREDFRIFKLNRIKNLKLTDESFERNIPEQVFKETEESIFDTITVTLLFNKELSFRVYDEFEENINVNSDGSLLVVAQLPSSDLLFSYIFSFGDKVEVIDPKSVRDEMIIRINKMKERYIT